MTASTYTVVVPADKAGWRLDRILADAIPDVSRTRLKDIVAAGAVSGIGRGRVADPAMRVAAGETFVVDLPPVAVAELTPEPIPLVVVHEDDDLIVVDKPPGLVVHPGAGHASGTLVNALLAHGDGRLSSIGAPLRPGIVHRIDKDTSGLLVVAKTDAAHTDLAEQFAEHSVERAYVAVVRGHPRPPAGRITGTIGRSRADPTRMAVVGRGGKVAVTRYRTQKTYPAGASIVECRLATGRTHQIRVHMSSIGNPVVGDPVYGGRRRGGGAAAIDSITFDRQALHAFLIGFRHPTTTERMTFTSSIPNDISNLMDILDQL